MHRIVAAGALLVLASAGASASTLNYDEAVDGDLPHPFEPLPTLTLGIGTNSIRGQLQTPYPGIELLDAFILEVPAGTAIATGALTYTFDNPLDGAKIYEVQWWGIGSSPFVHQALGGWPPDYFGPVSAGRYTWYTDLVTGAAGVATATYSYQFDLEVVPVPGPAAAWLMGSAVAILLPIRRLSRRSGAIQANANAMILLGDAKSNGVPMPKVMWTALAMSLLANLAATARTPASGPCSCRSYRSPLNVV